MIVLFQFYLQHRLAVFNEEQNSFLLLYPVLAILLKNEVIFVEIKLARK